MRFPAGSLLLALGGFGACVAVVVAVSGGVEGPRLAAITGVPVAAALAALLAARLARLDRAIGRVLFSPAADPAATIASVVACADAARRSGRIGLPHLAAEQRDPLLADGLRLIAVGAAPDVIRDVLERRLETGAARVWRLVRAGSVVRVSGPIAALPMLAATAAWMLGTGGVAGAGGAAPPPSGPLTAVGAVVALAVLPLIAAIGPARTEVRGRVAAEVLRATILIEGLVSIRSGLPARVIEERLLGLLPPGRLAGVRAVAA